MSTSTPQPQETPSFNEDESKAEEPVTAENSLYQDIPDLEEDESLNRPSFVQDSDEFRQRVDRAQELIKQTQIQKEKKEQEVCISSISFKNIRSRDLFVFNART